MYFYKFDEARRWSQIIYQILLKFLILLAINCHLVENIANTVFHFPLSLYIALLFKEFNIVKKWPRPASHLNCLLSLFFVLFTKKINLRDFTSVYFVFYLLLCNCMQVLAFIFSFFQYYYLNKSFLAISYGICLYQTRKEGLDHHSRWWLFFYLCLPSVEQNKY